MTITKLTLHAEEKATYVVSGTYYDESAVAITPTAANWTLTDTRGNVINSRSAVAIGSLSTTFAIVLSGSDLAVDGNATTIRRIAIQYTYNSLLGSNLIGRSQAEFYIDNYVAVS